MIVYPNDWEKEYEKYDSFYFNPCELLSKLYIILKKINVPHLAYSGGLDSTHHEFIVEPTNIETDKFKGDNAVRQLFELLPEFTNKIICCDGVDEFMCGYYDHQKDTANKYNYYLSRLLPDNLIPLNNSSRDTEVYLPYLDTQLTDIYKKIPLTVKVDSKHRKKPIIEIAKHLDIPNEFINRNKYGFCDAFVEKDK